MLPASGRIKFLGTLIFLVAILFAGRLFWVQVVHGSYYQDAALGQYEQSGGYLPFERGSILFSERDGASLQAATLGRGYLLAINPKQIRNIESVYEQIKFYISISHDEFIRKAGKANDPYEEIEHRISDENAQKIRALKITGIIITLEQWRTYPAGSLASQIIGFLGWNGNVQEGRYGIEREFESALVRSDSNLYRNFFSDIFLGVKKEVFDSSSERSADVVLTIEPHVQQLLESKLANLIERWSSKTVGGVIIDPQTGEIVAMATLPTFDPNKYGDVSDPSVYQNSLVEGAYELGSIMKPITIASAIDAGKVSATTTYFDKGYIELDKKRIENYDGKGRGVTSMQDVLNQSLNTGASFAALSMGKVGFRNYLERFGFGDRTEIDLPNEGGNLITNLESGRDVDIATASFGQGIAVTPIAMVRALSALGNGGYLVKPHVVKRLDYTIGLSKETERTEQGRAISGQTSEEITRMLVKVVDEYLAKGKLKLEHYSIAAKTGTAQIANPSGGGYYADRYLHSFFGYFPAYNPRFLVFLYMREPQNVNYASETLSEPFGEITKFLINYYNIPPDR